MDAVLKNAGKEKWQFCTGFIPVFFGQLLRSLEAEIAKLPARQREAFLMRYWDELSIAETAQIMGCSEGSVKTHCSRASQTLANALKIKGISL